MTNAKKQTNPFPGIRSFESSEDYLFFGREKQIEEVTVNLLNTHFIAIIGSSGCGKSSLVKAGVIPALLKHKFAKSENDWSLSILRPGDDPIGNMSTALYKYYDEQKLSSAQRLSKDQIDEKLRNDIHGLEAVINLQNKNNQRNRLIIIDQFEEIFRYKKSEVSDYSHKEALQFVNLFLTSCNTQTSNVYVILTMRSDFLGDCTEYPGLPEAINIGHYLVPRMNEDEKKKAIVGPITEFNATITEELTDRLLQDVGDDPDQLPVMQHALMRTWEYWRLNRTHNQPINIEHYEAIGAMNSALSLHAEEIFNELADEESRLITEKIFKSLTDLGSNNRGTRRPVQLHEIIALTEANENKVIKVIDDFRLEGRAFLQPPVEEELTMDSVIDISHESIMRVWTRLKDWVEDETRSAKLYMRLSKSAELYQEGKTGLWTNPDLQLALQWYNQNKPNATWAMRYEPAFDRAINYLEYSKKQHEQEIERKESKQKRNLKRARRFALILGSASIVSLLFLIVSLNLRFKAEASEKLALQKEQIAIIESNKASQQRKEAIIQKKISEQQQQIAEQQKLITEQQKQYAVKQQQIAIYQKQEALYQKNLAEEAKVIAINARIEAENQKSIALDQKQIAEQEKTNAENSEKNAQRLRMLALARSISIKASELSHTTNGDLPLLLALQAYYMNHNNGGLTNDPNIFNALLASSKTTKTIHGHSDAVKSVDVSKDGKLIVSASDDGTVKIWELNNPNALPRDIKLNKSDIEGIRTVKFGPKGQYLAAGSLTGDIFVWDIKSIMQKPLILKGHSSIVNSIDFNSNGDKLVSASNDGTLRLWELSSGNQKSTILENTNTRINIVKFNSTGDIIACGKHDGTITLHGLNNRKLFNTLFSFNSGYVLSLAFSDSENFLIAGSSKGQIKLWNINNHNNAYTEFIGHTSGITALCFNPKSQIFGSSSYDGTIRIWDYHKSETQPIIIKAHNDWVLDHTFTPNGSKLISAGADKSIKIWTVSPKALSDIICKSISRDLTNSEWNEYIGNDIPVQKPCSE